MNKQEKIREGAIISLMDYKGFLRAHTEYIIDCVLKHLDSQGVALVSYPAKGEDLTGFAIVKVESLIGE